MVGVLSFCMMARARSLLAYSYLPVVISHTSTRAAAFHGADRSVRANGGFKWILSRTITYAHNSRLPLRGKRPVFIWDRYDTDLASFIYEYL